MTLHRGQNKSRNLNFALYDPSQDSSVGSILAWYPGGPGFKSQQGFEWRLRRVYLFYSVGALVHGGCTN